LPVPATAGVVAKRDVAAEPAIVPHVRTDEEEASVADLRKTAAFLGAGVDRTPPPDVATRADDQPGRPAAIFDRLRRRAEGGKGCNDGTHADGRVAGDVDMGGEPASLADRGRGSKDPLGPH